MELLRHRWCHAADHWSDGGDQVRRLRCQSVRHERTVGDARAEDPAAVDLMLLAHAIHHESHKLHVIDVLLLCPYLFDASTVVPVAFLRLGINDQEALFRSQIVEPGVPLNLAGIAAASVKSKHHRQRLAEPPRNEHEILPVHSIDGDGMLNRFAFEPLCHGHDLEQGHEADSGHGGHGCTTHLAELQEEGSQYVDEIPRSFSAINRESGSPYFSITAHFL